MEFNMWCRFLIFATFILITYQLVLCNIPSPCIEILDFKKMFALLRTILCGLERDNCGATFRFCGHDV